MTQIDKKTFSALFFSIFSAVTGVGIVVPLLPVYAHNLGASGIYIALVFGGFSLTRTFFLPWFGRLSDQKGRKPFLTTGLFAYAVISVAFIFSESIESLIIIRMVQGVASAMIMPVAQAYIGDITPPGREGIIMGMFNMSIFLGLSIGPLLGGGIKDMFSLQAAFGCMGVLAFGSFLMSLFFLPPTREEQGVLAGYHPIPWRALIFDRTIVSLFAFRWVYATCIGIIWGFLPVYADVRFSLSSAAIGVLVVLGVSISGVLHVPMGAIADRMDKRVLVILGGLVSAAAILMIGWSGGFWDLFAANVVFGIGGGLGMPAMMALAVISGGEKEAMGAVMSLITIAHSLGMLCGSLFGGLVMDLFALHYAFSFGSLIMLFGVAVFFIGMRKRPKIQDSRFKIENSTDIPEF